MERYPIKGLISASMLDWPGRLVSVLFLSGCNFRCPYCHNPSLVKPDRSLEEIPFIAVKEFLKERDGWIDGVCITGGEPTLNKWLPGMIRELRALNLEVKLDTNGSRPQMLLELLGEKLVDFISMDVKSSLERYPEVTRVPVSTDDIRRSIEIIKSSGVNHEFRCTVIPGLVEEKDLISIAELLQGGEAFVLQQFRPGDTLDPAFGELEPYPDDLLNLWSEKTSNILPTLVRGSINVNVYRL